MILLPWATSSSIEGQTPPISPSSGGVKIVPGGKTDSVRFSKAGTMSCKAQQAVHGVLKHINTPTELMWKYTDYVSVHGIRPASITVSVFHTCHLTFACNLALYKVSAAKLAESVFG